MAKQAAPKKNSAESSPSVPSRYRGLRRGNPGNKGGGRTPDEFRKWCREVLHGPPTVEAVQIVAEQPSHPAFLGALKWLASYGYGQPTEHHEITGKDGAALQVMMVGGKRVQF